MIALELLVALVGVTIAGGAIAYLVRRVVLDQMQLQAAPTPSLEAMPEPRVHEPEPPARDPSLPAYVNPEDEASMEAWRNAQQEIEQAW